MSVIRLSCNKVLNDVDPVSKARQKIIYQKPKWKNLIYDATDEIQGKILVSYALIPQEFESLVRFS